MTKEYANIRAPEADVEAAREAKRDGETWGQYLRRCTDNPPDVRRFVPADEVEAGVTLDASEHRKIADALEERLR